jgi:hypothetical protein
MMNLVSTPTYTCQYCNHKFTKEKTLIVHVCEQKRRALARSERHVVLAFDTYNKFYKISQNAKGDKTYEEFARSPYYNAFIKFGSFVSNVNPLYPDKFIHYVITSGVKLDHWCRDELYDKYVVDLIKTEPVEVALERSINTMIAWGDTNNASWNHYFLYASASRIMFDVKDGKISPWLVLNSTSGKTALRNFDDTQLQAIGNVMDLPFWLNKFKKRLTDVELIKQVVKESNI